MTGYELTIPRALTQPILLAGMERKPALTVGLVAVGLIAYGGTIVTAALGILIWLATVPLVRRATKADPMMAEVYRRSLRYRGYYPARSTPWRTG